MSPSDGVELRGVDELTDEARAAIAAFVQEQRTLHDVVVAARALEPPSFVADVIAQDEYTNDVLLPWRDGLWLVYDAS